ncbi:hypothetical protein JAAARDRAFT_42393 [Jaapia argillacea MUCL 33604]|uniref:Uncharacterized protein n=1 Tax=Jaapia argillacea MUCL 33604 TaxID=933084 RepID=A0A067P537_9AGAM|nr:hypothetical protein JAAARDRAFT_42393 [Jaapia argillacea MUCL 33604]
MGVYTYSPICRHSILAPPLLCIIPLIRPRPPYFDGNHDLRPCSEGIARVVKPWFGPATTRRESDTLSSQAYTRRTPYNYNRTLFRSSDIAHSHFICCLARLSFNSDNIKSRSPPPTTHSTPPIHLLLLIGVYLVFLEHSQEQAPLRVSQTKLTSCYISLIHSGVFNLLGSTTMQLIQIASRTCAISFRRDYLSDIHHQD